MSNLRSRIRRLVLDENHISFIKDEDDTQFEIKDDDDEDIDGEEAGEEMTLQSRATDDGSGSKADADSLHPCDIDAFWLQRNVSKHCKVLFYFVYFDLEYMSSNIQSAILLLFRTPF